MISTHIPNDFQKTELEISHAISTLRRNGFNIQLPNSMVKKLQATTLFDGDDALFKELIKTTNTYFEYGCGKSTEFLLKHTDLNIFSVDTSLEWVRKMRSINTYTDTNRLNIEWIDVGELSDWGRPKSFSHRHNFQRYAECLWEKNKQPELVLIDGRFRVNCFLTTLKYAKVGTFILFDDYTDRPFYHVVEEFCTRIDVCGRQALFQVTSSAKSLVSEQILLTFQNIIE